MLTLDYRPLTLNDVVGQEHIKPILRAMVKTGKVPAALIFGGTRGTGKTTTARILAAALNCEDSQNGDACGKCPSCLSVQQSNSTAVLEVDAASNGGVAEVRRIKELCAYSHEGLWRVVLLDEAHSMSRDAFNALLKLLEEPPPATVFVLLTTEVDKILGTVRSRSMYFEFRRMTTADVVGRLETIAQKEGILYEPALLEEIAIRSQGGMRDAVMTLDQVAVVGIKSVDAFREMFGIRDVSVSLFSAAMDGRLADGYGLIDEQFYRTGDAAGLVADLIRLVRDLLVVKAGGALDGYSEEAVVEREALVDRLEVGQLVGAARVLWDLKERTRAVSDDQRSSMDLAYALLAEQVSGKRTQQARTPVAATPAPTTMSLGAMKSLAASANLTVR